MAPFHSFQLCRMLVGWDRMQPQISCHNKKLKLNQFEFIYISNSVEWWLVGIESNDKSDATKVAAPPPENQGLHLLADFSLQNLENIQILEV